MRFGLCDNHFVAGNFTQEDEINLYPFLTRKKDFHEDNSSVQSETYYIYLLFNDVYYLVKLSHVTGEKQYLSF